MKNLSVMRGALRHEFGMQIRRRAVWVVIVFLGGFVALIWYGNASDYLTGFYTNAHGAGPHVWVSPSTTTAVLYWAMLAARFLPLGVGLLLADRLVRDRQTRVDELLQTTPGGLGARLTGKYLGTTLATLVPVLVLYTAVVGYMFSQRPDGHALVMAALAFPLLLVPSSFFVAGFSLACTLLIKVPIYQFLFIGYWFWGNVLPAGRGIPTWSGTLLNASGQWVTDGLLRFEPGALTPRVTAMQALANIALLVALGLVALVAADWVVRWRQAAQ